MAENRRTGTRDEGSGAGHAAGRTEDGRPGRAEDARPGERGRAADPAVPRGRSSAVDRQRAVNALRETEFPVGLRGYERPRSIVTSKR